jgi:integrase/recombinase XerD
MFVLFVTTGLRKNELITLKISDVVGEHITTLGKGSKQRQLGLQPEVAKLLQSYIDWRIDKWGNTYPNVFITNQGRPFTACGIYRKIESLFIRAGLPPERVQSLCVHSLRHTFASNLLESGADIKILQVAMGHSTLKVTSDIYSHIRTSALDSAMKNQRKII